MIHRIKGIFSLKIYFDGLQYSRERKLMRKNFGAYIFKKENFSIATAVKAYPEHHSCLGSSTLCSIQ
jgi:hypothetical protein